MFYANPEDAATDWSVACSCREPSALTIAFVAHYLELGASEVHLFLDDPAPAMLRQMRRIAGCRITLCDTGYWADVIGKSRPKSHLKRQLENVLHAYNTAPSAWMLHVDADEFLQCRVPVSEQLRALPAEIEYITFPPAERAFLAETAQQGLFDGIARAPLPADWDDADRLLADEGSFVRRGLLGHAQGKSVMRTGRPMIPGIHSPRPGPRHERRYLTSWEARRGTLLHFDGLTGLHWAAKLLRLAGSSQDKLRIKRDNPPRYRQIAAISGADDPLAAAHDLHRRLTHLGAAEVARLDGLGLLVPIRIDPARAIARLRLRRKIDLSRAAFDREVAAGRADLDLARWETMLDARGATA